MTHRVMVWEKPYEVSTDRISKTVWRASGNYMGEYLQTNGPTEGAAVKRWREAAEYRGNG